MTTSPSEVPDCAYCGASWTLGGYAHSRTCFITTGELTVAAARKAKERRAQQKVETVKPTIDLEDE